MRTNLLVFAVVVSHSCITPAHTQEDCAGTPIPSDKENVSAQPISRLHGAALSSEPAAQTGSTTPLKSRPADELTYKAHLASARAFVNAKEKAKAIESYEKAILAAPNEKCREAAIEELKSFSAKRWWGWFLDSFRLFFQTIQPFLAWVVVGILLLYLRRFWRLLKGMLLHRTLYRVLIVPTSGSEFASYFCSLVQSAHDSFEEQYKLVDQINKRSSTTIAPTFQSSSLLKILPYGLPEILARKWWGSLVEPIFNAIDPPNYILHLGVSNAEKQYGLTVRLCRKGRFLGHWHESCANIDIHSIFRDLAYKVVEKINQREGKSLYGT